MSKLVWDQTNERLYETGVKNGVLYVMDGGEYGAGVEWFDGCYRKPFRRRSYRSLC